MSTAIWALGKLAHRDEATVRALLDGTDLAPFTEQGVSNVTYGLALARLLGLFEPETEWIQGPLY